MEWMTNEEIQAEINPTFSEEVSRAVKELSDYLSKCYSSAMSGNIQAWTEFCKTILACGFDTDLRLISQTFKNTDLGTYLKDKSLQRKSHNAMATIDPLYYVLRTIIPPSNELFSSLDKYMTNNARNFLKDIGEDINQFLIWMDYRTKGSSFICRMKRSVYESLRENISSKGDIFYVHSMLRALMAYKSVISRTQTMCDSLHIESGMQEKERLIRLRESKNKKTEEKNITLPTNKKKNKEVKKAVKEEIKEEPNFNTISLSLKEAREQKNNKKTKRA